MSRLSLNLILIALVWLPLGCAPAVQEVVHPDDALMAAIQAEDCMALWPLMTEDVQFYFKESKLFCDYYSENKSMFFKWAMRIHDRLMAEDINHYAYIKDDPEGAVRMKKTGDAWHFERPVLASNIYDAERLRDRFKRYLRTRDFRTDIQDYLEENELEYDRMASFLDVLHKPAFINFNGPFARVRWENYPIIVFFYYRKPAGAEEGAWEIYRCLF